jgi:hypothetical protein
MAKIDDIFNECYERIRSGESLESCLRSYPQYRAQLEPLLRTTFDIGRRISYIHPRPEFKHWAQVRIESVQRYPRQQTRAEAPAPSIWWRHGWAVAVSVGIVLVLTTGSTMAASSQALPDQPLYPVKLATEQVQRVLITSDAQKAEFETELAKIRAMELEAMANAGKTEEASKAAIRYDNQFEKAMAAIIKTEGTEAQPAITPPAETLPPATTTPPGIAPPPVVTTTSENTTPPPVIAPPPVVTTPPAVTTTTSENTTPAETTKPPTTATRDKGQSTKTERLIISLNKSTSKSVTALQDAKEKADKHDKKDWQKALNNLKSWSGDEDTTSKSDNVTRNQGKAGTGSTSQTIQSDNKTIQSDNKTTPGTASPIPTKYTPRNRR